jgi:hypothetical protein
MYHAAIALRPINTVNVSFSVAEVEKNKDQIHTIPLPQPRWSQIISILALTGSNNSFTR